jgi:hypothetical protein
MTQQIDACTTCNVGSRPSYTTTEEATPHGLLDRFGVPVGLTWWYNSTSSNHLSHQEAFSSISPLFLHFLQP